MRLIASYLKGIACVLNAYNDFQPLNNIVLNIRGTDLLLIISLIFDQINLVHIFEGFWKVYLP